MFTVKFAQVLLQLLNPHLISLLCKSRAIESLTWESAKTKLLKKMQPGPCSETETKKSSYDSVKLTNDSVHNLRNLF